MMHQLVFSFELGFLLRFSSICPQNINRVQRTMTRNNYEIASAKQTEARLDHAKRTEAGPMETLVHKWTEGEVV